MRFLFGFTGLLLSLTCTCAYGQSNGDSLHLYIDVHHLGPGKVTYEAVAKAHQKDLATEGKYGVHFLKYWVDEPGGIVYCLSSSPDPQAIRNTHAEAHGLLPDTVYEVTAGLPSKMTKGKNLYLDIHELGPGNVTPEAVAAAHQKDLAVEKKYGVNFIDYWVDPRAGVVMCLSEASDTSAVLATHKEAHGLMPMYIAQVKEGH
ncbi:DUF4242 domain-containing protein [Dinghuibacter silviterrae]|uniref:Uncharacterized protein DUF4242 n=1 Tax=Dinghuibacter silviterrae TaxID=1539049 RepID=A0A4R8DSG0_9BACT|nr:DUF4242 domain-containing protein [Dinghuibacter silviterrae]TDX01194.1 uncharacterized protein DUF4242 [Dinghuibacter silviterrae]